jgi:hypothetical protein
VYADDEVERTFQPEEFSEFEAYLYTSQGQVSVHPEVPGEPQEARGRKARSRQILPVGLLRSPRRKASVRAR